MSQVTRASESTSTIARLHKDLGNFRAIRSTFNLLGQQIATRLLIPADRDVRSRLQEKGQKDFGIDRHTVCDLGPYADWQSCDSATAVYAEYCERAVRAAAPSDSKPTRDAEYGLRELPHVHLLEANPKYSGIQS